MLTLFKPLPLSLILGQFKQYNRLTEIGPVDRVRHDTRAFVTDHELRALGAQGPEVDVGRVAEIDHALLAALRTQTRLRVPVLEEVVQSPAVHEDLARVDEPHSPRSRAIGLHAVFECRVVPAGLWREW